MRTVHHILFFSILLFTCEQKNPSDASAKKIDPNIGKLTSLDIKLGEPQPGDWLSVHEETGQTFDQYIKTNPIKTNAHRNKIYLQPVGEFSSAQEDVIIYTAEYLMYFFHLETIILPLVDDSMVPNSARRFTGYPHEQLLTGSILDYLSKNIPDDGVGIMAITAKDLYPSDKWNFVFGQARTKSRVGVSSIYRYADAPLDSTNYTICLERLIKTSSHELTHMLSCHHCIHAVCLMNGSNSLGEADSRPNRLCSECLRKLQWNVGFDVKKRLTKIEKYFAKYKLQRDHAMALKDLAAIN